MLYAQDVHTHISQQLPYKGTAKWHEKDPFDFPLPKQNHLMGMQMKATTMTREAACARESEGEPRQVTFSCFVEWGHPKSRPSSATRSRQVGLVMTHPHTRQKWSVKKVRMGWRTGRRR